MRSEINKIAYETIHTGKKFKLRDFIYSFMNYYLQEVEHGVTGEDLWDRYYTRFTWGGWEYRHGREEIIDIFNEWLKEYDTLLSDSSRIVKKSAVVHDIGLKHRFD